MTEQADETTETQSAVTVSDHGGVLMRISRVGLWVNPDIPADDCAQGVLESLRPLLSHTIDTEVQIQVARLTAERDAAQAEVERLKNAIDYLTRERDEVRDERDAVQRERERVQDLLTLAGRELSTLRKALRVRRRDQSAQNLDMADGQAILDSSRPDDETIWREAFMSAVHDVHKNWMDVADVALAQYRKRWPR